MTPDPACPTCKGSGEYMGGDEWHECFCVRRERRTLTRRRADSFQVGVLRGEISPFAGEVVKSDA